MFSKIYRGNKIQIELDTIQPIGFAAGIKAAQERIFTIRKSSTVPDDIPIIAIQNFLLEIGQEKWYDLGVIILEDRKQNINLQIFTQMTPVPTQIVETAQTSTPKNYSKDGFAVEIDSLMATSLQVMF
jgi:hypothetical protein